MARKLIVITGTNSGIGLEAAKSIASEGHTVIATVRSNEKGEHVIKEVKSEAPEADISYMLLDLTDFASIKSFADQLLNVKLNGRYIDTLVNNAGRLAQETHQTCPELAGAELTLSGNALGPLLLTELLLDHMKASAEHQGVARIVFTNSSVTLVNPYPSLFNNDDVWLKKEENYSTNQVLPYKTAKEILMMGSLALMDELGPDSKLKINSLCPGFVATNFMDHSTTRFMRFAKVIQVCCSCCAYCSCCGIQSVERGGDDIVALAIRDRGAGTGNFYVRGKRKAASALCREKNNQQFVLKEVRAILDELQAVQQ